MTQQTADDAAWVALGSMLAAGRQATRLSKRAAAERAGMSEGWWRQLEAGTRTLARGHVVGMRAKPETVVAAALAVNLDPVAALETVGYDPAFAEGVELTLPGDALAAELAGMRQELRALKGAVERLASVLLESPADPPAPGALPTPGASPVRSGARS